MSEKADAGREAMLRMVAGFEGLARGMIELQAVNVELLKVNRELAAQVALQIQHQAALMEHLAALQRQVAHLTTVEATRARIPVQPEGADPIGAIGQRVVDGIFGGFVPPDPPRRRRG